MYAPVRQNTFCKAADILADKCGCDVIARFETNRDAVEGDNLIKLQKRYSDECYVSEYLFFIIVHIIKYMLDRIKGMI